MVKKVTTKKQLRLTYLMSLSYNFPICFELPGSIVIGPQKLECLGLGNMAGSRISPSQHYCRTPTWETKGQEE